MASALLAPWNCDSGRDFAWPLADAWSSMANVAGAFKCVPVPVPFPSARVGDTFGAGGSRSPAPREL
eukprot:144132-Rhodomonas_salina.4